MARATAKGDLRIAPLSNQNRDALEDAAARV
jgi:hypothetical protein